MAITFPFNHQPYSSTAQAIAPSGTYTIPAGYYARATIIQIENGYLNLNGSQFLGSSHLDVNGSVNVNHVDPGVPTTTFTTLYTIPALFVGLVSYSVSSQILSGLFAATGGEMVDGTGGTAVGSYYFGGDYLRSYVQGNGGSNGTVAFTWSLRGFSPSFQGQYFWLKSGDVIASVSANANVLIELYPNIT